MVVGVVGGEGDVVETTASPDGEEGGDGGSPGVGVDEMLYTKKIIFLAI